MSNVNVRLDDKLKNDFQAVCADLGLDMTTAITIFAKKVTRERRIPFDVALDPFYSPANQRHLAQSIAQLGQGRAVAKTLADLEELENG